MYSKEKMAKYQINYYKKHRDKIIKYVKKWREKYATKIATKRAANYVNNKHNVCKTQKTKNWIKNGLNESDSEAMYDKYCNVTNCEKCDKIFTPDLHRLLDINDKIIICRSCYYKKIKSGLQSSLISLPEILL